MRPFTSKENKMLPFDENNRKERMEDYAQDFCLGQAMVNLGVTTITHLADAIPKGMTATTKAVVGGLTVRAIRQFRGIFALAEWGLVEDMEILCRSLFENALAVRFVLRPARRRKACSAALRARLAQLPVMPRRYRAVDFRAILYSAYWFIRTDKKAGGARAVRGLKRFSSKKTRDALSGAASEAQKLLGSWSKAQKDGYSGLSINLLAEYCGLGDMHTAVYGLMCSKTHANDALAHMDIADDGSWIASVGGHELKLQATMHLAANFLGIILHDVNRAFRLGLDAEHAKMIKGVRRLSAQ